MQLATSCMNCSCRVCGNSRGCCSEPPHNRILTKATKVKRASTRCAKDQQLISGLVVIHQLLGSGYCVVCCSSACTGRYALLSCRNTLSSSLLPVSLSYVSASACRQNVLQAHMTCFFSRHVVADCHTEAAEGQTTKKNTPYSENSGVLHLN